MKIDVGAFLACISVSNPLLVGCGGDGDMASSGYVDDCPELGAPCRDGDCPNADRVEELMACSLLDCGRISASDDTEEDTGTGAEAPVYDAEELCILQALRDRQAAHVAHSISLMGYAGTTTLYWVEAGGTLVMTRRPFSDQCSERDYEPLRRCQLAVAQSFEACLSADDPEVMNDCLAPESWFDDSTCVEVELEGCPS